MRRKYTEKEKKASNRYSIIKSRVGDDLEQYWSREDFINWYINKPQICCYCRCTLEEVNNENPQNSYPCSKLQGITEFFPFGYGFSCPKTDNWFYPAASCRELAS